MLLQSNLKFILYFFPVLVLWNSLPSFKTLHISQFECPHLYTPGSSLSTLNLERTKQSPKVLGFRNASLGGDGNTPDNLCEFNTDLCAFLRIS